MSALSQRPRVPTKATQLCAEQGRAGDCLQPTLAKGQGHTPDEARESLAEAIALILAGRREEGLRGVPPEAIRETVVVE